jgi:branched-chain amino acid transport system ATP-binding protein
MALLETRSLNKRFGGLQVTADVDFVLDPGELHCLIGPNGAGKSTLFRLILGEYQPTSGQISTTGATLRSLSRTIESGAASASNFRCPASSRR